MRIEEKEEYFFLLSFLPVHTPNLVGKNFQIELGIQNPPISMAVLLCVSWSLFPPVCHAQILHKPAV